MTLKKKLTIIALIVGATAIIGGCGKKTYNLNDYFSYQVTGYDNYAYVDDYFDSTAFSDALAEDLKIEEEEGQFSLFFKVDEYIDGAWDKSKELSNGDKIKFTWDINSISEFQKEYEKKIKLTYEDIDYTVDGLEVLPIIDIFEDINITLSGMAPNGTISVSSDKYPEIRYSVEPQAGLSDGDIVKISTKDVTDFCISQYHGIPNATSMDYTVEGLDHYLLSLEELNGEAIKLMQDQLDDFRVATYADSDKMTNPHYTDLGYILLTKKDPLSMNDNKLYNIYKEDFEYKDKGHVTRYLYYYYKNPVVYADGTVYVDVNNAGKPDSWIFSSEGFKKYDKNWVGYESYDKLYNFIVNSNKDKYIAEVSPEIEEKLSADNNDTSSETSDVADGKYHAWIEEATENELSFSYPGEDDIHTLKYSSDVVIELIEYGDNNKSSYDIDDFIGVLNETNKITYDDASGGANKVEYDGREYNLLASVDIEVKDGAITKISQQRVNE